MDKKAGMFVTRSACNQDFMICNNNCINARINMKTKSEYNKHSKTVNEMKQQMICLKWITYFINKYRNVLFLQF